VIRFIKLRGLVSVSEAVPTFLLPVYKRQKEAMLAPLSRRLSSTATLQNTHYNYLVIGAGSGGMASARRAADLHGQKVGIIERGPLGGTCVNVGCVPKKIMWTASELGQSTTLAKDYGYTAATKGAFDWSHLKAARDAYLLRLNGIYQRNLENSNVDIHYGFARFVAPTAEGNNNAAATVQVDGKILTADHVLVATGGYPTVPDVPGANGNSEKMSEMQQFINATRAKVESGRGKEALDSSALQAALASDKTSKFFEHKTTHSEHSKHPEQIGITSDGFFELQQQPKKVAIVGAGYIAVELAGVMAGLGSEVSLYIRGDTVLRSFDDLISSTITSELEKSGVAIHRRSNLVKVERCGDETSSGHQPGSISVHTTVEDVPQVDHGYDEIVYAIGRKPAVADLGLEHLPELALNESGHLINDHMSFTKQPNVYALGDVCGFWELTPVAIAAGRRLADNLFGGPQHSGAHIDYDKIPTVIFSHPPVGTIGMSEQEAVAKYGTEDVKCYTSTFVNLHYSMMDVEPGDKPKSHIKMICRKSTDEEVVGLHIVGLGADEMLQGFGVAMKMGATKADFDSSIAIHPTAAEEVVTLAPWGWRED
jgi:glutathione reductase (NADPH)